MSKTASIIDMIHLDTLILSNKKEQGLTIEKRLKTVNQNLICQHLSLSELRTTIDKKFHYIFINHKEIENPSVQEVLGSRKMASDSSIVYFIIKDYNNEVDVCFLKPITSESLHDLSSYSSVSHHKDRIIIKEKNLTVKLNIEDILLLKSDNVYTEIFTPNKKYIVRNYIEALVREISSPDILKIHRSYAVNVKKIEAINGKYVMVENQKYPLSRTYRKNVLERFKEI
ncbi:MAG: LytTR family transcriptional regulator [Cyclobacteriaceae bacterium]